jgi:hypothetical protein
MSEPTKATQSAPAPVATVPAVEAAKADDKSPAWLPERIEQAKRSAQADALKALGVDSRCGPTTSAPLDSSRTSER